MKSLTLILAPVIVAGICATGFALGLWQGFLAVAISFTGVLWVARASQDD